MVKKMIKKIPEKDCSEKVKQNKKVLHNKSFLEPKKISAPNNTKQIQASSFDNNKRDFIKKGLLGLGIGAGAALLSQIPFVKAVDYIHAPNIDNTLYVGSDPEYDTITKDIEYG